MHEQSIQEEVLGRLTWDNEFYWWSGEIDLYPGHRVKIAVSQEDTELLDALRSARHTLERIREEEVNLRHLAADELLAPHNEEWNDGLPIEKREFVEKMTLASIIFYPDGPADLCYRNAGLFEGHPIIIAVSAEGAFEGAGLAE